MAGSASAEEVLEFWFGADPDDRAEISKRTRDWFAADPAFDELIRTRFMATMNAAAAGELRLWKLAAHGTLALILLFDQFPRNIWRATPAAFSFDSRALALARDAVASGTDRELSFVERQFLYLPFEHAEDGEAQDKSVQCFQRLHDESPAELKDILGIALQHALEHREVIATFGRFPYRNLALDRPSTPAENDWLSAQHKKTSQG
jgi:uncharacterized protein (DUF924 family)